jgi:hypothetical protein
VRYCCKLGRVWVCVVKEEEEGNVEEGGAEMYSDRAVMRPRRTEYLCRVTSLVYQFGPQMGNLSKPVVKAYMQRDGWREKEHETRSRGRYLPIRHGPILRA